MTLQISIPDFKDKGWIPDECSGYGEDRSPEFFISGLSDNAKSIAITLDDLGHPIKPGYNHWIAWNILPTNHIPAGIPKGAIIESPIHMEQGIAYGKHCYRGPKPPFNWNHEYLFTVYELDCLLEADANSRREDILKLMENHIIGKAELRARYQRKRR